MKEHAYFFSSCSVLVLGVQNNFCSCSVLVRENRKKFCSCSVLVLEQEHVREQKFSKIFYVLVLFLFANKNKFANMFSNNLRVLSSLVRVLFKCCENMSCNKWVPYVSRVSFCLKYGKLNCVKMMHKNLSHTLSENINRRFKKLSLRKFDGRPRKERSHLKILNFEKKGWIIS